MLKSSLKDGPAKIAVRVREGDIVKVLAVEPKTYAYLTSSDNDDKDMLEKRKLNFELFSI